MKRLLLIISASILFIASPVLAQSSQAYSGNSSSIFAPKEGKSVKKNSRKKRNKKAYKNTSSKRKGLFAKKKGSDCDCPGSPKAKRKRRR